MADALPQTLMRGEEQNLFKSFRIGKEKISISHLHYSDDTLLFVDGGTSHLKNYIALVHCFELVS